MPAQVPQPGRLLAAHRDIETVQAGQGEAQKIRTQQSGRVRKSFYQTDGVGEVNEIICGNCAEVMATFPDDCIDLTVTSPPYDNLRDYEGYDFDFEAIAAQLWRVTKPGGVVVWVVGDATINGSETGTSFRQALYFMELGFNLHDTMIYNKRNVPPSVFP